MDGVSVGAGGGFGQEASLCGRSALNVEKWSPLTRNRDID